MSYLKHALKHARVIAWETLDGETISAARKRPNDYFRYAQGNRTSVGLVLESEIIDGAIRNLRVLEEFPTRSSLAEIVGDAPAFTFTVNNLKHGPLIAVRTDTDPKEPWRVVWERGQHGQYRDLDHMENDYFLYGPGPITSVVPLRPDTKTDESLFQTIGEKLPKHGQVCLARIKGNPELKPLIWLGVSNNQSTWKWQHRNGGDLIYASGGDKWQPHPSGEFL